jgi:hypothetical protein
MFVWELFITILLFNITVLALLPEAQTRVSNPSFFDPSYECVLGPQYKLP